MDLSLHCLYHLPEYPHTHLFRQGQATSRSRLRLRVILPRISWKAILIIDTKCQFAGQQSIQYKLRDQEKNVHPGLEMNESWQLKTSESWTLTQEPVVGCSWLSDKNAGHWRAKLWWILTPAGTQWRRTRVERELIILYIHHTLCQHAGLQWSWCGEGCL